MPKLLHQTLVEILRESPKLALKLLRQVDFPVPKGLRLRVVDSDLSTKDIVERRADVVAVARQKGKAMLAIVVEVQLRSDSRKLRAWPMYALLAGAANSCSSVVLVLAPSRRVADWARLRTEVQPGLTYAPVVIGPDELPEICSVDDARRNIELAVLLALSYAKSSPEIGKPVVERVLKACRRVPGRAGLVYSDMILGALGPALKEAMVPTLEGYKFRSEFAKKHQSIGRAEGEARGEERGKLEGVRQSIREVLRARKLRISTAAEKRIAREADLKTLRRWHTRAVTVEKASALFD